MCPMCRKEFFFIEKRDMNNDGKLEKIPVQQKKQRVHNDEGADIPGDDLEEDIDEFIEDDLGDDFCYKCN